MKTKKYKYIIIGNSAGGIGAAEAIRELDSQGSIAIVSDEPYPAYSRPLISEYLAAPRPVEEFVYRATDFYTKNNIDPILGEKVAAIAPETRTIKLGNGTTLGYEKLLLATGGTPIIPVMPGFDSTGVFTFNRMDDAKAIDKVLSHTHRKIKAVVIGGGLIGVSVTEALLRRNVEVVIVEMQDRILSAMLDEETSAMEAAALEAAGVTIITAQKAERINSNLRNEVTGIMLDDSKVIPCEIVIAAIGVRPRLDALEGSGIKTNRGIVVDRRMATSAPDVYACGDAAEAFDFIYQQDRLTPIWPNAYEGGRTAGLNMAGQLTEYTGGTAMNAMKYFGLHIVSAGLVNAPDDSYETLVHSSGENYRKVIIKDGQLRGLVFAGDIEKAGIVYNLMKNGTDVTAFQDELVKDGFGLASLPEEVWRKHIKRPEKAVTNSR